MEILRLHVHVLHVLVQIIWVEQEDDVTIGGRPSSFYGHLWLCCPSKPVSNLSRQWNFGCQSQGWWENSVDFIQILLLSQSQYFTRSNVTASIINLFDQGVPKPWSAKRDDVGRASLQQFRWLRSKWCIYCKWFNIYRNWNAIKDTNM